MPPNQAQAPRVFEGVGLALVKLEDFSRENLMRIRRNATTKVCRDETSASFLRFVLSPMDRVCNHCGALKFKEETSGFCCKEGKVHVPPLQDPGPVFVSWLDQENDESKFFVRNIRMLNSAFSMISMGTPMIYTHTIAD